MALSSKTLPLYDLTSGLLAERPATPTPTPTRLTAFIDEKGQPYLWNGVAWVPFGKNGLPS
jgi:hypothetical protein